MTIASDRRLTPRASALAHGIVAARIRPGRDACLIDVCLGGALIETVYRLLPGVSIELHLATVERCVAMRGQVLRCAVARLRASGVWYRGAISFDRRLCWLLDIGDLGYPIPVCEGHESRPAPVTRADASHPATPRSALSSEI